MWILTFNISISKKGKKRKRKRERKRKRGRSHKICVCYWDIFQISGYFLKEAFLGTFTKYFWKSIYIYQQKHIHPSTEPILKEFKAIIHHQWRVSFLSGSLSVQMVQSSVIWLVIYNNAIPTDLLSWSLIPLKKEGKVGTHFLLSVPQHTCWKFYGNKVIKCKEIE